MKHNETTHTSTSLHSLFLMCIYKTIIAILCLHVSLMVYMYKDIPYYLYKGISKVVHLLLSLLASLRNRNLRSSLLTSLPSLLEYMRNGFLQSSLLVPLQNNCVRAFSMTSTWKIFLHCVYQDISTITPIQVKPETTKSWVPLHSLLQPYMKYFYFYQLTTYYMIDYNHSINLGNIRTKVVRYIMSLKRKQRMKLNAYSHQENKYHLMFNNLLSYDSDLLRTNTHKGCCMLNANEYNFKLRSVIGGDMTRSYINGWYHRSWLTTQTLEEPYDVCSTWYMYRQQK